MNTSRRTFLQTAGSALAVTALNRSLRGEVADTATSSSAAPQADELCFTPARDLARLLRERKVSARELMTAHLRQIRRVNPKVNAIVAMLDEPACLALADAADEKLKRGDPVGPLHGLPTAIKDNEPVVGFPFTRGSPIYRNDRPKADSAIVERLRRAGTLIIGKTNLPEFAMGSHTYNQVYGTTLNPYDLTKSAGGSSGGAAVAAATGMVPIVNGSDLAGSLRNPANFNNVVGFRPTMGLVAATPNAAPFGSLAAKGPIARSVADAAFLMTVMAGADERDPASYPSDPTLFAQPLGRDLKGVRVAWCPDLGGLPMDPAVRSVIDAQRAVFERMGCIVEDAVPDLTAADEAFLTLRAWRSWNTWGPLLADHRGEMKPEAVGEIEIGRALTADAIWKATALQAQVMQQMRVFQEKYEVVLCAVNQVPPFTATLDWPKEINGTKMEHYIAWMKSTYWITATAHPSISVPAGFTSAGLPVGLQIVGRYRADFSLLQIAHAFEQATNVGKKRPAIAV